IDGRCTALSALCSDGTQCVVPGFACVDGTCEPRCDASSPCPTGYQCDLTRGVCNVDLSRRNDRRGGPLRSAVLDQRRGVRLPCLPAVCQWRVPAGSGSDVLV